MAYPPLTDTEKKFQNLFVYPYRSNFGVEEKVAGATEDWQWRTITNRSCGDADIKRHLSGNASMALGPRWYPTFWALDIDHPQDELEQAYNQFDRLGISESQTLQVTSPKYRKNGNKWIFFRPEYNGRPCTYKMLDNYFQPRFSPIENYPRQNKLGRIPLGRLSNIIIDDRVLSHLSLSEQLNLFEKIDPFELDYSKFYEGKKVSDKKANGNSVEHAEDEETGQSAVQSSKLSKTDIKQLINMGLQSVGTRYEAQFQILLYKFDENFMEEEAVAFTQDWMRRKSNGFSERVRRHDWKIIDKEIARQAKRIWSSYTKWLPDVTTKVSFVVTDEDLVLGANLFYGKTALQKQFFNLVAYYRARSANEFVVISKKNWCKNIASSRSYKKLQNFLEEKGILHADRRYQIGVASQKFKLVLPSNGRTIEQDGVNVGNFYQALKTVYNNDLRVIRGVTGMPDTTLFDNFGGLNNF